jgi:hypothetical protein
MHLTKDSQRRAIYRAAGSIAFDKDGPAGLVWATDPVTGFEADGLLGPGSSEEPRERNEAETLLRKLLGDGPVSANEILGAARATGVSERSLRRAKQRLGVRSYRTGQPGLRGGAWYWSLRDRD